jgi:hypothetical protein
MSEEREVLPQLLATFQRPDARLDATYYHADVRLPEAIGAPNAIGSVKDLDTLLHDLQSLLKPVYCGTSQSGFLWQPQLQRDTDGDLRSPR